MTHDSLSRPSTRSKDRDSLLEALFEEGLSNEPAAVGEKAQSRAINSKLYQHVEDLLTMLNDNSSSVAEMWALFKNDIHPIARQSKKGRPYSFVFAAKSLLRKLLSAHQQAVVEDGIPSALDIMTAYAQIGMLRPQDWKEFTWTLLKSQTIESLRNDREKVAEDVLLAWRLLLTMPARSAKTPLEEVNQTLDTPWQPPVIDPSKLMRLRQEGGLENIFHALLPSVPTPLHGMVPVALVTFGLLTDVRLTPGIAVALHDDFIKTVAQIMAWGHVSAGDISQYLRHHSVSLLHDLGVDFESMLRQASQLVRHVHQPAHHRPTLSHRVTVNHERQLFKRLERAKMSKDANVMDLLWREAQKSDTPEVADGVNDEAQLAKRRVPSKDLCESFIQAYMSIRKPQAIDVWNSMIQWGYQPTVTTWHAMLEGCKEARDFKALTGVWSKMTSSGIEPDVECWTTLITACMNCREVNAGLGAFNQMHLKWERAAKRLQKTAKTREGLASINNVSDVVKPTIAVINATIAGLLRNHRDDQVGQILATAEKMGIKPDTITFNTLLRSCVRKNDAAALKSLLKQMQAQGVRSDVATFTIILENAFSDMVDSTPEELIETVDMIFAEMDASSIRANQQTYAAIINTLLRSNIPETIGPVNHVMSRMSAMGLEPSPHIYTMLIEFYFSQATPNLDAVGQMLDRIVKTNQPRDHILWDRVIEGYCKANDINRALHWLRRMKKEGFKPGFVTLDILVHALVVNNEHELAKEVVRDTRIERGPPPLPEQRGVDGQHQFWQNAFRLGLMPPEEDDQAANA
jgi:pentatricopeptide repeat protein